MSLPNTYQEVEYIQSSWTQYINTWFVANTSDILNNLTLYIEASKSWTWNFMGSKSWTWDSVTYVTMESPWSTTTTLRCFNWNGNSYTDRSIIHNSLDTKDSIMFKYSSSSFVCTVNWTSYSVSRSSWYSTWNHPYFIFCRNNWADTSEQCLTMRFYKWYIDVWWTIVRDFIPCYRKSDWVIWLYDLVNNVFYTNVGTGTFTKWPDVIISTTWKIQHIYLYINWETKQVYPAATPEITYKYDFTDWTRTDSKLIADWWGWIWQQTTTPNGWTSYWMTMMSGWLWCYNTSTDKWCSAWKRINIPEGITHFYLKARWEKQGSWWWVSIALWDKNANWNIIWMWASYNSNKNWFNVNWADRKTWSALYYIEWEWEVDITTWAWSCTINSWWSWNWTIWAFNFWNEVYLRPWISKWYYQTPTYIYYIELKMR